MHDNKPTNTIDHISHKNCVMFLENHFWHGRPKCPYCTYQKNTPMKDGRYHCNICQTTFSITVATIFHGSRLPLDKWFLAIKCIISSKGTITTRELAKLVKINKNTANRLINKVYGEMTNTENRQLLLSIASMQE